MAHTRIDQNETEAEAEIEAKVEDYLRAAQSLADPALTDEENIEKAARHNLLLRMRYNLAGRDDFIAFCKLMSPDPESPDDPTKSMFKVAKHHKLIAETLMRVERGDAKQGDPRYVIITLPPRHGKSEMATRLFPAWFVGRKPFREVIVGAYNQDFSQGFGKNVLATMQSPMFKQVFPDMRLDPRSQNSQEQRTLEGGVLLFTSPTGSATGYGADLFVIDDPIKNLEEAKNKKARDKVWDWFKAVAFTRMLPGGRIVILLTRWHEDDIVGRLRSDEYISEEVRSKWTIIDLPAIAEENDPLGRATGEALWADRYPIEELQNIKAHIGDSLFSSLYQQKPSPDDGTYFTRDMIQYYGPNDLPSGLTIYAASDHAVSSAETADKTAMVVAGWDTKGNLWLLDMFWKRSAPNETANAMISLMAKWKPRTWWAAADHIGRSIGPFVRQMMREQNIICHIKEVREAKDKETRAQSIRGLMSNSRVFIPKNATWTHDLVDELLNFPVGKHDDAVDALAHIGMGLMSMVPTSAPPVEKPVPPWNSGHWLLKDRGKPTPKPAFNGWLMQ